MGFKSNMKGVRLKPQNILHPKSGLQRHKGKTVIIATISPAGAPGKFGFIGFDGSVY